MQPDEPKSPERSRQAGSARRRQQERKARKVQAGNSQPPNGETYAPPRERRRTQRQPRARTESWSSILQTRLAQLQASIRNFSWNASSGQIALIVVVLIGLVLVFSVMVIYAQDTILPGVSIAGINVSGMNEAEAAETLRESWASQSLVLHDGEHEWRVSSAELGYSIDAVVSARQAFQYGREEGGLNAMISSALTGYDIAPIIELDLDVARGTLIHYWSIVGTPAENATIRMQGVVVTPIAARNGSRLNVQMALLALESNPASIIANGVVELPMLVVEPIITDVTPLVEYAQALLEYPLGIEAYDPVTDQGYPLDVLPQEWGQWLDTRLEYHRTGPRLYLTLSVPELRAYLEEQTATLPFPLTLDIDESIHVVQNMVTNGTLNTWITVRYQPTVHIIERGETAYSISRSEGIPFYLIEQANPDINLADEETILYVGNEINLPSRDSMLPLRPVRNKRIVLDLSDQHMWAYENEETVYEWPISSGRSDAPTSTGVFQILSHEERAYGSGFALCTDEESSCGQWIMHWFMGIYEAVPGLMNGFHGAVELPNNQLLGGGSVGRPVTFGCIMAVEENAITLYQWAEQGTVVEIRP